jgi:hypothetical protein
MGWGGVGVCVCGVRMALECVYDSWCVCVVASVVCGDASLCIGVSA